MLNRLIYLLALLLANADCLACVNGDFYALSPNDMKCVEFKSSCDIPDKWVRLTSCDLTKVVEGKKVGKIGDPFDRVGDTLRDSGEDRQKMFSEIIKGNLSAINNEAKPPEVRGMQFYKNEGANPDKEISKRPKQTDKVEPRISKNSFYFGEKDSQEGDEN